MSEGANAAGSPAGDSVVGVLPEVVKGLRHDPALLFGIGAGVVIVAALAATTSVWLVLVVATVLVLALAAWLVREAAKERAQPGVRNRVRASHSHIGSAEVSVVEGGGSVDLDVDATGATIADGATVGKVSS